MKSCNSKKLHIICIGFSGFPYGNAAIQRTLLLSKASILGGAKVTVINSRSIHKAKDHPEIRKIGHYEGIVYINSSGSPFRDNNFIKWNLKKIYERILEFNTIVCLNRRENINIAITNTMSFSRLLLYRLLCQLLHIKLLLNYVEYNSFMQNRDHVSQKINDFFYDKYATKICDGILPISEFLIEKIKIDSPKKKYLKIPVMVDPVRFNTPKPMMDEKYFLFCGSAGYSEIIEFIIKSFEKINLSETVYLYIIVNGSMQQMNSLEKMVSDSPKRNLIRKFSKISDTQLVQYYQGAVALLIPLRPTFQDLARFPHKIGEYLASGRPLITTNWGEIKIYLKNNVNSVIADNYDITEFSQKMDFILKNPDVALAIGQKGKQLAAEMFDYKIYRNKLVDFFNSVID